MYRIKIQLFNLFISSFFFVNFIISLSYFLPLPFPFLFFIHPRFSSLTSVLPVYVYRIDIYFFLPSPSPPFISLFFLIVKSSKKYVLLFSSYYFRPHSHSDSLLLSSPIIINSSVHCSFFFLFFSFSFANNKTNYYRHACTHRKSSLVQVAYA